MDINIFILCYNESPLIAHTINHYKKYLPSCKITIYDNESTDNSVFIAKLLGCEVISWSSNNILNENIQVQIRNSCWKNIQKGWILIVDMDEFICVTEAELFYEMQKETDVLQIIGLEMIGESQTLDLSDINLQEIKKYIDNHRESKNLCFLREKIVEMNYDPGSHNCYPITVNTIVNTNVNKINGINYSSKVYMNKHMSNLGLNFLTNKMIKRYERTELMRTMGLAIHYTDDINNIKTNYNQLLNNCKLLIE